MENSLSCVIESPNNVIPVLGIGVCIEVPMRSPYGKTIMFFFVISLDDMIFADKMYFILNIEHGVKFVFT